MKVYVRNDNPVKNKIGVYKVYERKVRNDAYGDYVLIGRRKYYIYENGHVRMAMDK